MSEMPVPQTAPCDVCGQHPSLVAVMNLADYSQDKLCPWCAPDMLRGIAASVEAAFPPPLPDGTVTEPVPRGDSGGDAGVLAAAEEATEP